MTVYVPNARELDLWRKTLGGQNPAGAALRTGDLSQIAKYLVDTTPPAANKDADFRAQIEALVVQLLEGVGSNALSADPAGTLGEQIAAAAQAGGKAPVMIGTDSPESIGVQLAAWTLGAWPAGATLASAAWPTANLAMIVPFVLAQAVTVVKGFVSNAPTISGNIDWGIYDAAYAKQVSSGSVAQANAAGIQEFDVADTPLAAGRYYLAIALDNNTGALVRYAPSDLAGTLSGTNVTHPWGVAQMAAAFPLPATFVPADMGSRYIPRIGLSLRTQVA